MSKKESTQKSSNSFSEKQIETQILDWLNQQPDIWAWKNETMGVYNTKRGTYRKPGKFVFKGKPDIEGFKKKIFDQVFQPCTVSFFIEVKKPGGKLSEAQKAFHTKLESMNIQVTTVSSLEEAKKWVGEHITCR